MLIAGLEAVMNLLQSLTAKSAMTAKEKKSLTAKDAVDAKLKNNLNRPRERNAR